MLKKSMVAFMDGPLYNHQMSALISAMPEQCNIPIGPGQLEGIGHLVHLSLEEGDESVKAAGPVPPLVVVVVSEGDRTQPADKTPALPKGLQVFELLVVVLADNVTQIHAVFELGDAPNLRIVGVLDGLTPKVYNLQ